jgi:PTS system ascorbate-specific IIB component
MNVEDVLGDLDYEANVDFTDVSSARGDTADIIVTNPELAPRLEGHQAEIVVVKSYVDKDEIREALAPALERHA